MAILQQQYTGVFKGTKPKGALRIPLQLCSGGVRLLPSNWASPTGPATSASSIVFVIGSISFSLWARFSDGALRGQHDKPYNRFRPDQQGSQTGARTEIWVPIMMV